MTIAIMESRFIDMIGSKAILLSPVLLIVALIIMFRRIDKEATLNSHLSPAS